MATSQHCVARGCLGLACFGWLGTPERLACRLHTDLIWPGGWAVTPARVEEGRAAIEPKARPSLVSDGKGAGPKPAAGKAQGSLF